MNPVPFCQKESFLVGGNGCLWCLLAYRRPCWPAGSLSVIGAGYTFQSPCWPPGPSSPRLLVLFITHMICPSHFLYSPLHSPSLYLLLSLSPAIHSLLLCSVFISCYPSLALSYFLFPPVIPHIHSLSCSLANSLSPRLCLALLSPGHIHSDFFSL